MIVALVALTLCGCTAQPPERGVVPSGGPPVIVPGEPGQPAATATPGRRLGREQGPNAADVRFAEAMITHHRAALDMALLVPSRTTSAPVRALATRVALSQEAEITWLTAWLGRLGRTAPHGHGHDMGALKAARGEAFDRLFLREMIVHHEGALDLATAVLDGGTDPAVRRLATDIDAAQSAEIERMRGLLP